MTNEIRPGEIMFDTEGKRIHIHGGSIIALGHLYYWYGEDKSLSTPATGRWHSGVRAYSSPDLTTWTDLGSILPAEPDDSESPLHPAAMMDRPHIVRHPATGAFVCWLKVMHKDGKQRSWVYQADRFEGPYRLVRPGFEPLGMSAGDFDIVVDPETGRGYYYFERVHSELICADLTEDLTDVTGTYSTHFPHPHPPLVREAPAYFRHEGRHYLVTSGTSWYFPNRSEIAVADDYHGPWKVIGDPHKNDPTGTSFHSQISSVLSLGNGRHLALADRWLPDMPDEMIYRSWQATEAQFTGGQPDPDIDAIVQEGAPDTSVARHVWLELRFEDGQPVIEWQDAWRP
ncbi:family 43 glycosylhydrolase [Arthrobacter sp. Rue61a]|uniref:family 43 glycosylhydrolase n=1 Tax=Arthrobacter sp. Rue61a TaxID=1118963 RepID=UPI0002E9C524|nr:family 43 glycosylhydrolase [Arthrobacter sp. Rue61a]